MSQRDDTVKLESENVEASGQNSEDAVGEPQDVADAQHARPAEVASEVRAGSLTIEALNRYLAAAAEDREAAEERSAEVIARFSKLTIALMCVTMVIAGANVAMIIRQSNAPQPVIVAAPRPAEAPPLVVQPAPPILPAPVPSEPSEPPRPAEKIPLLGSPPSPRATQVPTPGATRLARTPPPRPQPLLSVRNMDNGESSTVERW